jgi:hypothetical protein
MTTSTTPNPGFGPQPPSPNATSLPGPFGAGLNALSLAQTVEFTRYVLLVLPLDGFVFWVKADLLSPSAQLNASLFNQVPFNQAPTVEVPAATLLVQGALHYATDRRQEETETFEVNRVLFTTQTDVDFLNQIGPNEMYLATFNGVRFTFSQRGAFFAQTNTYHYAGAAVYSDMAAQIVDALDGFDSRGLVVSNSLPAWLGLNGYVPIYQTFGNPVMTLYPSFALPPNLPSTQPYASVHVAPEGTKALQSAPLIDPLSSHDQLCSDRVRITMYGMRNDQAQDFVDCVNQWSLDYDVIGIMNSPVVRDEKRNQVELNALAQKKTVDFEVSYHQSRINDLARQLILSAIPSLILQ